MKPRMPRNYIEVFPHDRTIEIAEVAPSGIKQNQQELADCPEIPMEWESAQEVYSKLEYFRKFFTRLSGLKSPKVKSTYCGIV